MSNSKWVKLIARLVENCHLIKECRVKLLGEEYTGLRLLRIDEDVTFNFDYYPAAMEAMISGKPYGWKFYCQIEWLDFPSTVTDAQGRPVAQDTAAIQDQIAEVGRFQLALTGDNLRLYAYQQVNSST
ncbi:hypothetical protein [Hymenobacter cellulosivorans]|uniref:Uncharacterized protein n=1 Tax=Hymenobacter cellulosivorans TaxID=2932249 RepID=A0ABY4F3P8_9BACT|nr:hypothetical protein [Hymenobacter cellulosivorans]UOQ51279.1 hypothetical protein MUN80_16115 [Hymenobacter cellulosivorans]